MSATPRCLTYGLSLAIPIVLWVFTLCSLGMTFLSRETTFTSNALSVPSALTNNQLLLATELRKLGLRSASQPASQMTLIGPDGTPLAQGEQAVFELVSSHYASQSQLKDAMLMAGALLGCSLFTLTSEAAASVLVVSSPFPLSIAAFALGVPCLTCSSKGPLLWLQSLLPFGLLVTAVIYAVCLWRRPRKPELNAVLLVALSASIILIQGALLLTTPKFCPWCLLIGCTAFAVLAHSAQSIKESKKIVYRLPSASFKLFAASQAAAGMYLVTTATGRLDPFYLPNSKSVAIESFQPVKTYLRNLPSQQLPTGLLVVTIPGCSACDKAKSSLERARQTYTEFMPCSYLGNQPCFDSHGKTIQAPTFLVVDGNGSILTSSVGFNERSTMQFLSESLSKIK